MPKIEEHGRLPMNIALDVAPTEVLNPDADKPLLIIADHAGRAVPQSMVDGTGPLGVSLDAFDTHVAWDIGAGGVARYLANKLDVTAVLAVYTRLLIDPNRALGDTDCVIATSDGTLIPANQQLSDRDVEARASAYYWPYHCAIDLALGRLLRSG